MVGDIATAVAIVALLGAVAAAYRWGYDQGRTDAENDLAETIDLRSCGCAFCASTPEPTRPATPYVQRDV